MENQSPYKILGIPTYATRENVINAFEEQTCYSSKAPLYSYEKIFNTYDKIIKTFNNSINTPCNK
tara:strand:+ start:81 stop:275 length:195 start_codon:yes stop_codon:yes gene_type:complete